MFLGIAILLFYSKVSGSTGFWTNRVGPFTNLQVSHVGKEGRGIAPHPSNLNFPPFPRIKNHCIHGIFPIRSILQSNYRRNGSELESSDPLKGKRRRIRVQTCLIWSIWGPGNSAKSKKFRPHPTSILCYLRSTPPPRSQILSKWLCRVTNWRKISGVARHGITQGWVLRVPRCNPRHHPAWNLAGSWADTQKILKFL